MSAHMILEYLGEKEAATKIETAVLDVLKEGKIRTADLGGSSTTREMGSIRSRERSNPFPEVSSIFKLTAGPSAKTSTYVYWST